MAPLTQIPAGCRMGGKIVIFVRPGLRVAGEAGLARFSIFLTGHPRLWVSGEADGNGSRKTGEKGRVANQNS